MCSRGQSNDHASRRATHEGGLQWIGGTPDLALWRCAGCGTFVLRTGLLELRLGPTTVHALSHTLHRFEARRHADPDGPIPAIAFDAAGTLLNVEPDQLLALTALFDRANVLDAADRERRIVTVHSAPLTGEVH